MAAVLCSTAFAQEGLAKLTTGREIFARPAPAATAATARARPTHRLAFRNPTRFPISRRATRRPRNGTVDWRATVKQGGRRPRLLAHHAVFQRGADAAADRPGGRLPARALQGQGLASRRAESAARAAHREGVPRERSGAHDGRQRDRLRRHSQNITYEKRFGANTTWRCRAFALSKDTGRWMGGIGDISVGLKRVLASSLHTGSIVSVQGEVKLPTGNRQLGFGQGVTVFEAFGAYDQLLPAQTFLDSRAASSVRPIPAPRRPRSTGVGGSEEPPQEDGVGRCGRP